MYSIEELAPQLVIEVMDKDRGFRGYIVIDRILGGSATGGVRMGEDITLDEVANLAREMTLKFGFLNIRQGGAKAGIISASSLSPEERKNLFLAFGKRLGPILKRKIYFSGEDLGTFYDDIYHLRKGAGLDVIKPGVNEDKPGYYTALTVFITVQRVVESMKLNMSDCSVAIEGFGKVGESVAQLFSESGAMVVAISTIKGAIYNPQGLETNRLIKLKRKFGDDLIAHYKDAKIIRREELLTLDLDILVPCARPDALNADNVSQLGAKIIVPGANIPATAEIEELMFKRGIIYIPGFVSNCGGVLRFSLESQGFNKKEIERIMWEGLGDKVSEILTSSAKQGVSPSQIARKISEKNLKRMEGEEDSKKLERVLALLKDWQKGGIQKLLGIILWRFYKLSRKYRSGFLLKPFVIRYMKDRHFGVYSV